MKNIKELTLDNLDEILSLIFRNNSEFETFSQIGWDKKNIKNQFLKTKNFSIGYYKDGKLLGFLIGDNVKINKYFELELYILFVDKSERRSKIATTILKYIELNKKFNNISKIYLEVAENNTEALEFYKKNNFVFLNFRHNYYKYKDEKVNAICLLKKF